MPGIIPEGMGLLAGGPKVGKSWLGYALSLAIARGADALGGIPTGTARPVLYLALEDGDRRMKERRQVLLGDDRCRKTCTSSHSTAGQTRMVSQSGSTLRKPCRSIEEWLDIYGDMSPLVVIDTLTKPSPLRPGKVRRSTDTTTAWAVG